MLDLLAQRGGGLVDDAAFDALKAALDGVDESTIRAAVRESGLPMSPMTEGVRQDTFDDLERTLIALAGEYERGDAARRRSVRALVITAKDHAGFAARSSKVEAGQRAVKEEMLLWMRTWLENPALFGAWVGIRKRTAAQDPQ